MNTETSFKKFDKILISGLDDIFLRFSKNKPKKLVATMDFKKMMHNALIYLSYVKLRMSLIREQIERFIFPSKINLRQKYWSYVRLDLDFEIHWEIILCSEIILTCFQVYITFKISGKKDMHEFWKRTGKEKQYINM